MKPNLQFTSSLILDNHPMKCVNPKLKIQYYMVLEYFVKQFEDNEYTDFRLNQYKDILLENNLKPDLTNTSIDNVIRSMVNCTLKPWKKKYRYLIMCDIALVLLDEINIQKAADSMKLFLTKRKQKQIDVLLSVLKNDKFDKNSINFASDLIEQYRKNYHFLKKPELRFIITANMSAGKSTLVNALIGKSLARTSQEVCTGNICYIYNKPFEDNHIHFENSQLNLDANVSDIKNFSWERASSSASYFRHLSEQKIRICIIDTPGVNSTLNKKHGEITREAIKSESYHKLIYVLNANKLGTDEEIKYLKWISENVPMNKIIFVLNKLDDFKCIDDDIEASIEDVRNDLFNLGYKNPTICPISAYFALLIKLKHKGERLTDDEEAEYELYTKKFSRPFYDLLKYYVGIDGDINDDETILMSKKCGLYGFEKVLFGGEL
ncbi:dynamin family protein [Turicibacter sanguinis]|uniref:dynamin family protein n=1 Tax=Turicibacter sanguinis TaxID=154288 RepID=UPI00189FB77D|nr:dynamin family protein [Turicibacter sanguinis]